MLTADTKMDEDTIDGECIHGNDGGVDLGTKKRKRESSTKEEDEDEDDASNDTEIQNSSNDNTEHINNDQDPANSSTTTTTSNRRVNYVGHIKDILEAVRRDESHLFNDEEWAFFDRYLSLIESAQSLYLQLYQRTKGWKKLSGMTYNHIEDLDVALQDLVAKGLAATDETMTIEEGVEICTQEDLKSLTKNLVNVTGIRDKQAIATNIKRALQAQPSVNQFFASKKTKQAQPTQNNREEQFLSRMRKRLGPCIRIFEESRALFHRLLLVYYRAMEYSDKPLTSYILSTISAMKYASYTCQRSSHIFPDRATLIEYERALILMKSVEELATHKDWNGIVELTTLNVLDAWRQYVVMKRGHESGLVYLQQFHPGWPLTKLLESRCIALEKLSNYSEAASLYTELLDQSLFRLSKRGHWYERLALIQSKYLEPKDENKHLARATCLRALEDRFVIMGDLRAIKKRLDALDKKLNTTSQTTGETHAAKPTEARERAFIGIKVSTGDTGKKSLWQGEQEVVTVEQYALECYANDGWEGVHCENSMITTLFGLLFWDILFDERVSYAFESPYQTHPLDLLTESFYYDRRPAIDARIQEIASGRHMELIQKHEEKFRDICCIGVRWDYESHVLLTIAAALGPHALSEICQLFAQNYKQYCGGLPDLCLWRYQDDGRPECMFAEVKGPNDRLSTQQMEWIDFLSPLVNIELCKVVELVIN